MDAPHVSTASVLRQSPGAEEVGGVCLLAWPEPGHPGSAASLAGREDAHLAALAIEVVRRPHWHVVVAALLVHPIDSRPSTYPRVARAALDHLPEATPGEAAWRPDSAARLSALYGSSHAGWTLRCDQPSPPIERPIVSRVQTWRSAIGGAGYFDLRVGFGVDLPGAALPARDEAAARAALAGQPHAIVLGLTLPPGLADDVAHGMTGRLARVAILQAASVACG